MNTPIIDRDLTKQAPHSPRERIAGLAWAGQLAYDPASIRASVAVIRGEWDKASTATDAHWLFDSLKNSPVRRMVTISRATHLIHLEESRFALYRETEIFLNGNDLPVKAPFPEN